MKDLITFYTVESLESYLISVRGDLNVGLVPTMGALHHGHLSLVEKSMKMCDIVVVSIFVNPTQFNNPGDLEKYPRNLQKDIDLLQTAGEVIVFAPMPNDVYPEGYVAPKVELGTLATSMEGEFRPGHFDGVVGVVKRLFDIVLPSMAFFGLKDFQQLAVIRKMVDVLSVPTIIYPCEIIREPSGLASSSRNERLSDKQKEDAIIIHKTLTRAKKLAKKASINEVVDFVATSFEGSDLELEYFNIVDPETLVDLTEWKSGAQACIAAFCGEVRLIDNMCIY